MDPRTRIALLGATGFLAVALDRPLALGLLAATTSAVLLLRPIGWAWRRRAIAVAGVAVWSMVVSQGLFYADVPRVPLLSVGPITVWREGVLHGLAQSMRVVATGFAGVAVAVSTPPDRLFAALLWYRVPYAVAFLAVTALRAVPVAGAELWAVREARARRGRPLLQRSPWDWLRTEMLMLQPVVARALRRATALSEALETRGFDPIRPRRLRAPLRFAAWERLLLAGVVAGLVGLTAAELAFQLYVAEVAYHPGLRPLYGFVRAWL